MLQVLLLSLTITCVFASTGLKNVLMLVVDDLRPVGKAFGQPEALTPNIDALAARGTIFSNAYVQAATCGVSRSSFLTGRRPDTTQVLDNDVCPFSTQPEHEDWLSMPAYFANSGYQTHGIGKIWHPNICEGAEVGEHAADWTNGYYHAPCISLGSIYNHTCYEDYPGPLPMGPGGKVTSIYANATQNSADDMPDGMIAAHAVDTLKEYSQKLRENQDEKPFFLAVGFHKPHLPHIAPKEFFDLYPLEDVSLPSEADRSAPQTLDGVWPDSAEFRTYADVAKMTKAENFSETNHLTDKSTREQRRAYYAAASFTDAQIGKVCDNANLIYINMYINIHPYIHMYKYTFFYFSDFLNDSLIVFVECVDTCGCFV